MGRHSGPVAGPAQPAQQDSWFVRPPKPLADAPVRAEPLATGDADDATGRAADHAPASEPLDGGMDTGNHERTGAVGQAGTAHAGTAQADIGRADIGQADTGQADTAQADGGKAGSEKVTDRVGGNGSSTASDGRAGGGTRAEFSAWERPRLSAFGGLPADGADRRGDPSASADASGSGSVSAAASEGERADAAGIGTALGTGVEVPTMELSPLDAPDRDRVGEAGGDAPEDTRSEVQSRAGRDPEPPEKKSDRLRDDGARQSTEQEQGPPKDVDSVADSGTVEPQSPDVSVRSTNAAALRVVGEILITLGVVLLLFCVYQLFYTNIESNRAQAKVKSGLQHDWRQPQHVPDADPVPDDFSGIGQGDAFAIMYIPRLGSAWQKPVVEGVELNDLARGLGHYPDSAMPGEVGNFAVAGHRATHGEPFRDLNELQQGDVVIVETENNWYRYVIDKHQIVEPTDVEVVLPVPNQPGAKPTEKLITLTTCNPRWASTQRLIYWGHLESVTSKAAGVPAELQN